MEITPEPVAPDPADPSSPHWVPPEGNTVVAPDLGGLVPDEPPAG